MVAGGCQPNSLSYPSTQYPRKVALVNNLILVVNSLTILGTNNVFSGTFKCSNQYAVNDWNRFKGTAYEEGIDDKTKIARLVDEVSDLREEISNLKHEYIDF